MSFAESVRRAAGTDAASGDATLVSPEDATTDPQGFGELYAELKKMHQEFTLAAPRGVDPHAFADQLIRDAISAIRANPDLFGCDFKTLLGALMTCAQLGFRPGVLGEAYLVPYAGRVQFIIGYKGLVQLAHRSGKVRSLAARTVGTLDQFTLNYTDQRDHLEHRPYLGDDPNPPVMYYARAILTNGGTMMTRPATVASMLAHAAQYSRGKKGPWNNPPASREFEGMAWKTELRRLCPLLPLSTDMGLALAADYGVRSDYSRRVDPAQATEPTGETIDVEAEEIHHD